MAEVRLVWRYLKTRLEIAARYRVFVWDRPIMWARLLFLDRESTNFTYDIANVKEIADWAAAAMGAPADEMRRYVAEVEADLELRDALVLLLRTRRNRNSRPRFGRRIGWYCLLRAAKPKLAIETGTHDGLGTALLARGMQRNAAEGSPGELVSFDIDPGAGWLIPAFLRGNVEIVTGDALETLPVFLKGREVDFFMHDSDHAAGHERMELQLALTYAAPRLLLLSDNSHTTNELRDLSESVGAAFSFVAERPRRHFYPGAGIGLAVLERVS